MSKCPACGHENPPVAKFCLECGARMTEAAPISREERKVVTVVFADLVGFTSRSEQLDPEDVRAFLSPYYARLRVELERHGGTVEKFIGDAVMALFGAPTAHEDDPERAVRAALAIRDWIRDQDELQVRIAVNTGEVLVALGAQAAQGEGMASGDVVNTTARLQSAAPVNGILVGETTYRATSQVITYRPAEAVTAKGKAEPVPAWEALEARSRFGSDIVSGPRSPLVGREHEVSALSGVLARVRNDRSTQLVTVVGVPGIGKSRLVAELFEQVRDDPSELILWRQGRSLPYGDGVTFWALAEIVKAQAGILETDTEEQAAEKLREAVAAVISTPRDAEWVALHLRPLAGLSGGAETGGDRQSEAFTAWRRFFEALTDQHPLILVFDDVQWADANLLDFVEYLVDWATSVPLLVVCITRPDLFDRRPGWGGGKRNATTLSLAPLSDEDTGVLLSTLSDRLALPVELQQELLARAGGNPLYAEQYVRMLDERSGSEALPLPETVQGIIAARLDGLPPDEKSLLQNAAVMGKVFWLGAVAAVCGIERHVAEQRLHDLERKEFVQQARRSSVADEAEYAFMHVLVRDVAYGQIPRALRAEKHELAAEWIAALGRNEDHAEMHAHHYLSALELRRAAGLALDARLRARATESLREAGDRAYSLNAYASATGFYESALELAPTSSTDRATLLYKIGRARFAGGYDGPELLAAASAELIACGDFEAAAEAEAALGDLFWQRGERDRGYEHVERATALVADRQPSRAKAFVTSNLARYLAISCEDDAEAIRLGREALAMAEGLGLDDLRSHALNNIGMARVHSGDDRGVGDLEESVAIAVRANAPDEICRAQNNLGAILWEQGHLRRARAVREEGTQCASRFGQAAYVRWFRAMAIYNQYILGHWREAESEVNDFIAEVEGGSPHYLASGCYHVRAQIRLSRDDTAGALADAERAVELARLAKDPQNLEETLARLTSLFYEAGMAERAAELTDELLARLRTGKDLGAGVESLHALAWTLSALGRGRELLELLPSRESLWVRAAAEFAAGNVGGAADICASMGAAVEEARDRLALAEQLVEQNRRAEADTQLRKALAFFRSVGATRYIRQGEALLAESA